MISYHTTHKIAALRQRGDADESELQYLDDLCLAGGCSDYVDEIVERLADSRTCDGATDEREYARALSYAGFSAYARR